MNSDSLYRLLMDSSWLFLSGWSVALVAVSVIAFRQEYRVRPEGLRSRSSVRS
jgi:hypothetical protein